MNRTTKSLLISGLVTSAVGGAIAGNLVPTGDLAAAHVTLPLGVILLGLALISRLLQAETAAYDREHSAHESKPEAANKSCCEGKERRLVAKARHA